MRFVQIKTEEHQAVLALHTEGGILIRERIACSNSLRATLAEFGTTIAAGQSHLSRELPIILEDGEKGLSPIVRTSIYRQANHIRELEEQDKQVEEALPPGTECSCLPENGQNSGGWHAYGHLCDSSSR